jgi:transcriptional regulator with XRE-family HTH domain
MLADTFDAVLFAVLGSTKWTMRDLAARVGVSPKTIGRYVNGRAVPPVARRHGFVAALRDLDRPMLERVATSLGLSLDAIPPRPRTPADAATSQRILDAATLEVAERLDAGPIRVRAALARFVARLAEGNIDPGTAHALLTRG